MSYVPPHLELQRHPQITGMPLRNPQAQTLGARSQGSLDLQEWHHPPAFVPLDAGPTPQGSSRSQPSRWNPCLSLGRPSDRVLSLTSEQIEEVQMRLNVDVTVASDSPPAPAPVESFTDMHCLAQPPICRGNGPLALVLAPTRELAQQIEKEVKAFSRSSETIKTAVVVGGTNMSEQKYELRAGVHIVVATPGRFIDHLQQGNTSLSRISFVVLDEADRMLDMGFEPQIREAPAYYQYLQLLLASMRIPDLHFNIHTLLSILFLNSVMQSLPKKHQTLLFSATMPVEIETLAQARCDEVAEALVAQGLHAVALHGGPNQSEREAALNNFRKGTTNILVATDVASRGLDVTGVAHVINLDLPKTMEDYVHRIGRTGRAGSVGHATSFYTDRDMESTLYFLHRLKHGKHFNFF
ncbi:hypothetical protein J5N97_025850 [Dioscorea zingiberensis]|uniref:RNA helicase n=1 Tax=Dioscorea zingiberensis TaxID=325984 RepID=A0A9D5H6C9_9LILI|nr:hypothetical protein J5N97_025850 [Dioscorea zingiberensis]